MEKWKKYDESESRTRNLLLSWQTLCHGLGLNWVAWARHYTGYVTTPSWISTSQTEKNGDGIAQSVERLP